MREMDSFSYAMGVIDAFNEVVRAGVKKLALAHPVRDRQLREELAQAAESICAQYGTRLYREDDPLLTDLFPVSLNRGTYNILFYQNEEVLSEYLELKQRKKQLQEEGRYAGQERKEIARSFGHLLSYTDEAIERLIAGNHEKEAFS